MKTLLVPALLLAATGCSVVKSHTLRDDWAQEDQKALKRVAVLVQPVPAGKQAVGEAAARIARRYVNMKRDFLVKVEVVQTEPVAKEAACGGEDNIEALLHLAMTLDQQGSGVEAQVTGTLTRCSDGRQAWAATAAGSFPSKDDQLKEVAANYVQEYGAEVEPFIAPLFNILRPTLDTLPQPLLTEEDREEKIILGE